MRSKWMFPADLNRLARPLVTCVDDWTIFPQYLVIRPAFGEINWKPEHLYYKYWYMYLEYS